MPLPAEHKDEEDEATLLSPAGYCDSDKDLDDENKSDSYIRRTRISREHRQNLSEVNEDDSGLS